MDPLSPQLVRALAARQGESLISCYVPLERTGADVRQNAIRLEACRRTLAAARGVAADARAVAAAERELTRVASAAENPQALRGPGVVALFAAPDSAVAVSAPATFAPLVTIAPRFYVVPLLSRSAAAPAVRVLALGRRGVRLVEHATARELPLPATVPRRPLESRVGDEAGLDAHCRRIARALAGELDRPGTTVVLAGDAEITAAFRRAAAGWPLLDAQIRGNHDATAAVQLAAFATPLVAARESAASAEWKALFGERTAERRASDDPEEIAAAASSGRIDTLLLERAAALDRPHQRTSREAPALEPEGPFNSEAVLTLRSGGDVRILAASHMPTRAAQAAILRF